MSIKCHLPQFRQLFIWQVPLLLMWTTDTDYRSGEQDVQQGLVYTKRTFWCENTLILKTVLHHPVLARDLLLTGKSAWRHHAIRCSNWEVNKRWRGGCLSTPSVHTRDYVAYCAFQRNTTLLLVVRPAIYIPPEILCVQLLIYHWDWADWLQMIWHRVHKIGKAEKHFRSPF